MSKYLLTSDQHVHDWSAFRSVDADGVNSRLRIILNEMERAVKLAVKLGCTKHRMAGDLFHVRGSVKPSVLNPTVRAVQKWLEELVHECIAGNHDLEGRDAEALGNAMQVLDELNGFTAIVNVREYDDVVMFPWFADLDVLRAEMKRLADPDKDAIIHAPVNGVIKGIPDHGLEADELSEMGFKRVFSGHYHNHKVFCGGKVISIGATTHQTWCDVDTRAGFLIVDEDTFEFHESEAPKFLDMDDETLAALDRHDTPVADLVGGNYVRIKLDEVTDHEITEIREELEGAGALGVRVIATKKREVTRLGVSRTASMTLEQTVAEYVSEHLKPDDVLAVQKAAQDVLIEARSR